MIIIFLFYILPVICGLIDWNIYNWKDIHIIRDMIFPDYGIDVLGDRGSKCWVLIYAPIVNLMCVICPIIKLIAFVLFDICKINKLINKFLDIRIK